MEERDLLSRMARLRGTDTRPVGDSARPCYEECLVAGVPCESWWRAMNSLSYEWVALMGGLRGAERRFDQDHPMWKRGVEQIPGKKNGRQSKPGMAIPSEFRCTMEYVLLDYLQGLSRLVSEVKHPFSQTYIAGY